MFDTSEAAFRFILILSIFVLVVLASISTVNCHNIRLAGTQSKKTDESFASSYEGRPLNSEFSGGLLNLDAGDSQRKVRDELITKLNESFAVNMVAVATDDVWVLKSTDEALKKMGVKPPQNHITIEQSIIDNSNRNALDFIACVVPATQYVNNSKFGCTALNQTMRTYDSCKVRVFDAYYDVCSTCFRANVYTEGGVHIQNGPVMNAIYLLRPFGMTVDGSKMMRVNTIFDPDNVGNNKKGYVNVIVDGYDKVIKEKDAKPASIVVYYLDYVGPISDVSKYPTASKFKSEVDTNNQTLTVNSSNVFSYTINFNNTSPITNTNTPTLKYPGIINAAKLAKQFQSSKYSGDPSTTIQSSIEWLNGPAYGSDSVDTSTMFGNQSSTGPGRGCAAPKNDPYVFYGPRPMVNAFYGVGANPGFSPRCGV